MNVYLVQVGCYSSKQVIAAFSQEKAAKDLADGLKAYYGDARVICVGLNPTGPLPPPDEGFTPFTVTMWRSGTSDVVDFADVDEREQAIFGPVAKPAGKRIEVVCWAKDEQHAVKIANEIRTRMIAEGTWPK